MKKLTVLIILIIAVFIGCSAKKPVMSEFSFANKLAQQGLWKEAHYRWKKVLAAGKESAAVYNNIAVALEHLGRFEEAEEAYKKALEISPNNSSIDSNYKKLKKVLSGENGDLEKGEENGKPKKKKKKK